MKDNSEIKKKHDKTLEEGICRNKSLDKQRIDAYGHLTQNSNRKYSMCNNDDNPINDEEIDINEYYRKFTKYVRPHLEDPVLRGYNVDEFGNVATLDQIGKIQLDDGPTNPKPSGYIFETSTAYKK